MSKVILEIWIDLVCPFCYLAKKKLTFALQQHAHSDPIEIRWRSFQLDPQFPLNQSLSSFDYLQIRKGLSTTQIEQMCIPLEKEGKQFGIQFNFKKSLNFNTFKAHQLLHWAGDAQERLMNAFYEAIFCKAADLSKLENLLDVCEQVGLDRLDAKNVLELNTFGEAVENDIAEAQSIQLRGVPSFVHAKQLVLYGAPEIEHFEQLFINLTKHIKHKPPASKNHCKLSV